MFGSLEEHRLEETIDTIVICVKSVSLRDYSELNSLHSMRLKDSLGDDIH